jgi:hypothetical protein
VTARGTTLEFGAAKPLFRPPFNVMPVAVRARYSVANDGRVLARLESGGMAVTVIINWTEQLKSGAARE